MRLEFTPEIKKIMAKSVELDLNFTTVRERVELGVAKKDVLKMPKYSRCYLNKKESKIRQACKDHGVRYDIIQRRMRKGMSLKKALSVQYEREKMEYVTLQ